LKIQGLDHFNLRASRELLEALREFYCEVIGLSAGYRPPFKEFGYWLYAGEQAVVHLVEADGGEIPLTDRVTTFGHVAFACTGRSATEKHLQELGMNYAVAHVPESGQIQLFLKDPAGNGIELSFDATEA